MLLGVVVVLMSWPLHIVQVDPNDLSRLDEALTDLDWVGAWFHQRLQRRSLRPAARISYERTAFFGHTRDAPVRMTIDRNLIGTPANDWCLTPLVDEIFSSPVRNYRARCKAALVMQGILERETVRPPLLAITDEERERIRKALIFAGELDQKVGAAKASS